LNYSTNKLKSELSNLQQALEKSIFYKSQKITKLLIFPLKLNLENLKLLDKILNSFNMIDHFIFSLVEF